MRRVVFGVLVAVAMLPGVSAVVFYDQGTGVVDSNGTSLELGNLSVFIYDEMSGGNLVWSSDYSDAINNGSWNVKIEADLYYGKSYFKDYEINGDDMDFNGDERVEFVSPYGVINDEAWVNFSLIGSCPEGSSIREVLGNGSVVCEVDSLGNGSVEVDLGDYALKNQSEVFTGNITTSEGGFFGWLGGLGSRVSKIFVDDLDVDGLIVLNGTAIEDWDEVSGEGVWSEEGGVVSYDGNVNVSGNLTVDTVFAHAYDTASPLVLRVDGFDAVYIDDVTGAVGIRTTEPQASFDVNVADFLMRGDVRVLSNLTAGHFFGDGSGLTGVVSEVDSNLDLNNVSLNDTLSFSECDARMYVKGGELFIEY